MLLLLITKLNLVKNVMNTVLHVLVLINKIVYNVLKQENMMEITNVLNVKELPIKMKLVIV